MKNVETFNSSKIKFIFDPIIIKECIKDIEQNFNKKEFMEEMINKRLIICEKLYIEEFDKSLELLTQTNNLKEIGKIIKKLCKLSENLYNTELKVFKKLI